LTDDDRKDQWIIVFHDDVTIKTVIKILLFNARDRGRLAGTKQRKFTENRTLAHINTAYIQKLDHFS